MSTDDNPSLQPDSSAVRTLAVRQAGPLESSNGQWSGFPEAGPQARHSSADLSLYLHALRRHWVLATFIGLVCAIPAGVAVFFLYGAGYESQAFLRVATAQGVIAFQVEAPQGAQPSEYEIYKSSQQQLLKSRLVLNKAMGRPELRKFNIDSRYSDPVQWLAKHLSVSYPGKAEIMEVGLTTPDPEESQALVDAVVTAYMTNIVEAERTKRRDRLNQLDGVYATAGSEVRSKLTELKQLAEQLGTSDQKTASLKQTLAVQQFHEYQMQLMRIQFDLRRVRAEVDAQRAQLQLVSDMEIPVFELDNYTRNDPQAKQLFDELAAQKMQLAYTESIVKVGNKSSYLVKNLRDLEMLQVQVQQRQKEVGDAIRNMKKVDIEKDKVKKETEMASLAEQEADFKQEVEKKKQEAERYGISSIDLEMLHTQIDHLQSVLKALSDERQKLGVEVNAPSRITVLQSADRPETAALPGIRWLLTSVAMLVAFCLPVGLIAWQDVCTQRINSSEEVSQKLGLPVMGSLPVIPARAIRRLGAPSRRLQNWQMRLTESVDSIAARLHRKAALDQTRVVLVSSAVGGEGKTTLASQLALSLARSGRRTALVDFDLRRPALNSVFGVPLEPGLSDVLRGTTDLADIVHQTATEHLSVIAAGRWDRLALAALANGAAGPIFEKLRAEFEFVLVDSSPILPVADTRFLSQHVDTVILSVFRDVSQRPKVHAAREILEAFGVPTVETVVTGPSDHMRDRDMGYESSLSK